MKLRTKKYINRKKAFRDMIQFRDLRSFLAAGLALSRSAVVRRDIRNTLQEIEQFSYKIA